MSFADSWRVRPGRIGGPGWRRWLRSAGIALAFLWGTSGFGQTTFMPFWASFSGSDGNFGTVPIGSTASIQLTVTLPASNNTAGFTGARVVSQGAPTTEFSIDGSGTDPFSWFDPNTFGTASYSLTVKFTPQGPGLRSAAVLLTGYDNQVDGVIQFYGIGQAPVDSFSPAGTAQLSPGPVTPWLDDLGERMDPPTQVALDGKGGLYLGTQSGNVYYMPLGAAGALTRRVTSLWLGSVEAMTVDAAGNLYFLDSGVGPVLELVRFLKPGISPLPSPVTVDLQSAVFNPLHPLGPDVVPFQLNGPSGLGMDRLGNLYVTDADPSAASGSRLVKIAPNVQPLAQKIGYTFIAFASSVVTLTPPPGVTLGRLNAVAVALDGVVYLTDQTNGVVAYDPNASGPTNTTVVTYQGQPLLGCYALAADPLGNVYAQLPDGSGLARILRLSSGPLTLVGEATAFGYGNQAGGGGMAADALGNLFVADTLHGRVLEINGAAAPPLEFAFAASGVHSSSNPQTVTLTNLGNADLALGSATFFVDTLLDFTWALELDVPTPQLSRDPGSTRAAGPLTLAPGASVHLSFDCTPTSPDTVAATVNLVDNAAGSPHPITMVSQGSRQTPVVGLHLSTSSAPYGVPVGVTLTAAAPAGSTSPAVPSGNIELLNQTATGGTSEGNIQLAAGSASFPLFLPAGSYSLYAAYGGDANYFGNSTIGAQQLLTVTQAVPTLTLESDPATGNPPAGTAMSFTATLFSQGRPVSDPDRGSVDLYVDGVPSSLPLDPQGTAHAAAATLAPGRHTIQAVYPGNGNFTGASSPTLALDVGSVATTLAGPAPIPVPIGAVPPGGVPLGASSGPTVLNFNLGSGVQPANVHADVLTEGASVPGQGFQLAAPLDPTARPLAVGVTFTPVTPGTMAGAVVLTDSSTSPPTPLLAVPLVGTGLGSLAVFSPGADPAALATGLAPSQAALDGAGNLFLVNGATGDLATLAAATPPVPAGGLGLTPLIPAATAPGAAALAGVVLDGAGNLFYSDPANGRIWVSAGLGTGAPQSLDLRTAQGASFVLETPTALAMDPAGTLYILDAATNQCFQATPSLVGGEWTATGAPLPVAPAGATPPGSLQAVAADPFGNVFLADGKAHLIRVAGGASSLVTLPDGITLNDCTGVGVDRVGNLYLADYGGAAGTRIVRVTRDLASASVVPMPGLAPAPGAGIHNLTVDGYGNILVPDPGNNRMLQVMASAPGLTFAATPVGTPGPAQPVTVADLGNAPLTLACDYSQAPDLKPLPVSSPVRAGGSALLLVQTDPSQTGARPRQTVSLVDNGPVQFPGAHSITVTLTGPATAGGASGGTGGTASTGLNLASSLNPAPPQTGVILTATLGTGPGQGTPTGTVTFTDGPAPLGSAQLDASGVATLGFQGLPGQHPITASYPGDGTFAGSSSTLAQVVNAYAATVTLTATPAANPVADPSLTFTATVAGQAPAPTGPPVPVTAGGSLGTVTFLDGGKVLGSGPFALDAAGQAVAGPLSLGPGAHAITARFSGNPLYPVADSAALLVTAPVNAGQVPVGQGPLPVPVSFAPGSLGAPVTSSAQVSVTVLNEGTGLGPFALSGTPALAADGTLTVGVSFAPNLPGLGRAALVATLAGHPVTVPLYGTGTGPLAVFSPGAAALRVEPAAAGLAPAQVAVDAAGTVYLATGTAGSLATLGPVGRTVPAAGQGFTSTALAGGSDAQGLALGAGVVFYSDRAHGRIGVLGAAQPIAFTGHAPVQPTRLAADAFGNLYWLDAGTTPPQCLAATPLQGPGGQGWTAAGTVQASMGEPAQGSSASLGAPLGLAVGPDRTVYLVDGSSNVFQLAPGGPLALLPLPAGLTLNGCSGVGVDALGNVYVADTDPAQPGTARILCLPRIPNPQAVPLVVPPALPEPATVPIAAGVTSLAVDPYGNLLVADPAGGQLLQLPAGSAPALDFPGTAAGSASPARTVVVANLGNQDLSFTGAPAFTADFTQAADPDPLAAATVLAPGATADVAVRFSPGAASLAGLTSAPLAADLAVPVGPGAIIQFAGGNLIHLSGTATSGSGGGSPGGGGGPGGSGGTLATSVTLASSLNPAPPATDVTLAATVAGPEGQGTPTGTVTFTDAGASLGSASLDGSGVATLVFSSLKPAHHPIAAVYGGDGSFAGSGATLDQDIAPFSTALTLTSSALTSSEGELVTFTAQVQALAQLVANARLGLAGVLPPAPLPTGAVEFRANGQLLATRPLANGVATYSTSTLAVGTDTITASYGGDTEDAASSAALAEQVQLPALAIAGPAGLSVSPGNPASITLTVSSSAPVAGAVTLVLNGTLPAGITGQLSSVTLDLSQGPRAVQLTVTEAAAAQVRATARGRGPRPPWRWPAFALLVCALPALPRAWSRLRPGLLALAAGLLLAGYLACSSGFCPALKPGPAGNGPGAQPASYALTVTASAPEAVSATDTLTLTVEP